MTSEDMDRRATLAVTLLFHHLGRRSCFIKVNKRLERCTKLLAQRRVPLIEIGRLRRVSRPALRAAQERGA